MGTRCIFLVGFYKHCALVYRSGQLNTVILLRNCFMALGIHTDLQNEAKPQISSN